MEAKKTKSIMTKGSAERKPKRVKSGQKITYFKDGEKLTWMNHGHRNIEWYKTAW